MKHPVHQITGLILLFISGLVRATPMNQPNLITYHDITRIILGLLLVLLIISLLSWVIKRLRLVNLSSSSGFRTIASMTLGARGQMMLVNVGERYLLIGVGSGAINLLHDFGTALPEGFATDNKPAFAELFKSVVRKP